MKMYDPPMDRFEPPDATEDRGEADTRPSIFDERVELPKLSPLEEVRQRAFLMGKFMPHAFAEGLTRWQVQLIAGVAMDLAYRCAEKYQSLCYILASTLREWPLIEQIRDEDAAELGKEER